MNMADRIQYLRKTKGISQEELADKVGVSRQAVSKWESEQSMPDLDKVITMSEYFEVTTDFILKGIEPLEDSDKKGTELTSGILYVGSAALVVIGLFCAFGGWYEEQTAEAVWGAMIIQAAGLAGYFIGRLISAAKAPLIINWLNIVLCAFMPVSLTVMACMGRKISPYPTDLTSGVVFAAVFAVMAGLTFFLLKRKR